MRSRSGFEDGHPMWRAEIFAISAWEGEPGATQPNHLQ